jgi:hypothetical protein
MQIIIIKNQNPINFKSIKLINFKAIGDTIALSVLTRKHLKKINLIEFEEMTKGLITFLIKKILYD